MKAVQILGDASSPRIATTSSIPTPTPTATQILIRVHAAGITGDEITWPEVHQTATHIPGHDISGVVSSLGPDYKGPLQVGDEVYALIAAERGEGQAEYALCLADEEVARKPASLSHEEAAALPIPLLTAWEAMQDHARVAHGSRVLVTGASGSVGVILVQLLNQVACAHVIALASPEKHTMLKTLGAREVVDYHNPDWDKQVGTVDAVLDTVGGDILAKTWPLLQDAGALVTVGHPEPSWAFGRGKAPEAEGRPRLRYAHFIVSPHAARLDVSRDMIDAGSLKPLAVKAFAFEEAGEAWAYAQRRGRGDKAVIRFV